MAPFSIPTPAIIPLRVPVFGGPKSIDTNTKVQLLCETYLEHEIFYTLDGTKPQPYAGIVQGNKTIKYTVPFCLPPGKITIRALAINSSVHTMCSSIVTKCFDVLKVESEGNSELNVKARQSKKEKLKNLVVCENKENSKDIDKVEEKLPDVTVKSLETVNVEGSDTPTNCLEEAFIGSSDFELDNPEDSIEDESCFPIDEDIVDANGNLETSETVMCGIEGTTVKNDSLSEAMENFTLGTDKKLATALTDSGTSVGTQFCCLKCDLTLQHCVTCNKMNAVSSKFCIGCGGQLLHICYFCKEWNPSIATFCQFCGKKIGTRMEPYIRLDQCDQSVMAKPQLKNTSIQTVPMLVDKCTQTVHEKSPVKRASAVKRISQHSPGKGYWHQQLDYICNHLKSHAYNNVEFRKEISEPSLCDFKSACIVKDENDIVVSLSFTSLLGDKNCLPTSEELKSKNKRPEGP